MVVKIFWQILFGILVVLIVLLSILNTDRVSFDYIFATITLPLIILISIPFALGLVIGSFITKFIQITRINSGVKK